MNLDNVVAIDIETYDPNLTELGNGAIRKDGYLLSCALADKDGEICLNPAEPKDMAMLKDLLANDTIIKVAHNGVYDYDWLQNGIGLQINGRMEDTMTREGLINEYAGAFGLEACCKRRGISGKITENTIDKWWADHGGTGSAVANLPLIPFDVIAKYNKQDARATFNLFVAQQQELESMRLIESNNLECSLYPIILEMRKNGIRIDVPRVDQLREDTQKEVDYGMQELEEGYGIKSFGQRKGLGSIAFALERLGATEGMMRTATGDLSIAFNSLVRCPHPVAKEIIRLKRKQTLLDKYLNSAFTKYLIGDRIHGTFKPTQRDEGGTVTGRFSSSDPNMQNFSARESKGGDLVRGVFLPDEGHWLGKLDYSQIEYRLLAHFAIGPGSEALREQIRTGADYHQIVQDMLGWSGPDARKRVKVFNFGMLYGMGLKRFQENFELEAREVAAEMGMTTDQYTQHYYNEYIRRMTFLKPTTQSIMAISLQNKYIRSIGGRVHHCPPDGGLYKMPNYLIQGSAAEINKMGLSNAWKAGIFDVLKLHLTVHDESVVSVPMSKVGLEAVQALEQIMCNCVQLKVPIIVDPGIGTDWYEAGEKDGKKLFLQECEKVGLSA